MKMIKLLSILIVILGIANVTLSNHSLDDSKQVADLSKEVSLLERDNAILTSRVADAGSLLKLQEKIAEAGYVEAETIVTLNIPSTVASR